MLASSNLQRIQDDIAVVGGVQDALHQDFQAVSLLVQELEREETSFDTSRSSTLKWSHPRPLFLARLKSPGFILCQQQRT